MATVNARYQGTYQPRVPITGRAFTGGAGRVAHTDFGSQLRPEGCADVAVYRLDRRLSSCLPICGPPLGLPVFLASNGR
jgi:hypothetical protein